MLLFWFCFIHSFQRSVTVVATATAEPSSDSEMALIFFLAAFKCSVTISLFHNSSSSTTPSAISIRSTNFAMDSIVSIKIVFFYRLFERHPYTQIPIEYTAISIDIVIWNVLTGLRDSWSHNSFNRKFEFNRNSIQFIDGIWYDIIWVKR